LANLVKIFPGSVGGKKNYFFTIMIGQYFTYLRYKNIGLVLYIQQ